MSTGITDSRGYIKVDSVTRPMDSAFGHRYEQLESDDPNGFMLAPGETMKVWEWVWIIPMPFPLFNRVQLFNEDGALVKSAVVVNWAKKLLHLPA